MLAGTGADTLTEYNCVANSISARHCPCHTQDKDWDALMREAQDGNWELKVHNRAVATKSLQWGEITKRLNVEYLNHDHGNPNVLATERRLMSLSSLANSRKRSGISYCAIHDSWTHRTLACPEFKDHVNNHKESPVHDFEEQLLIYWDMHGDERIKHIEGLRGGGA